MRQQWTTNGRPPERATAMITESEFIAAADRTLAADRRGARCGARQSDADVDWSLNDGILEIDCGDGGKLIVNRHVPNREIWVAARSGGFHFRSREGRWRDTRSGEELASALGALVAAQAGLTMVLPPLAAPDT